MSTTPEGLNPAITHREIVFDDPDLVPLRISAEMVDEVRKSLPELPAVQCRRFIEAYVLPEYDAAGLQLQDA